jgi:RNA polymerase sigma-70 factor, ECF subfamily
MIQQLARVTQDREISVFNRLSDEDLPIRAQQGDQRALLELVDRKYQRWFKLAFIIMRDQHEAEDQVQTAFLRALEHLDQFRYKAQFSSWLARIVINQCRMRFREMQRTRPAGTAEDCYPAGAILISDATPNAEHGLLEKDLWKSVKAEIKLLPPVYREPIILRYLDHLSLPDLADRLGLTIPAVKSRLLRGQAELRRRMMKTTRFATDTRPLLNTF